MHNSNYLIHATLHEMQINVNLHTERSSCVAALFSQETEREGERECAWNGKFYDIAFKIDGVH